MEYYLTLKKKEILPFVAAWMDLESIMLSEISQSEKDKYYMISLICDDCWEEGGMRGAGVEEDMNGDGW